MGKIAKLLEAIGASHRITAAELPKQANLCPVSRTDVIEVKHIKFHSREIVIKRQMYGHHKESPSRNLRDHGITQTEQVENIGADHLIRRNIVFVQHG
jgi:hypothetical protein